MTVPRHAALAAGRWHTMSIVEQLANVGSEVERVLSARDSGKSGRFDSALTRALELFDLTAADERWRGPRRREVLRAREELCEVLFGDAEPRPDAARMRRYYLEFATAANRARELPDR